MAAQCLMSLINQHILSFSSLLLGNIPSPQIPLAKIYPDNPKSTLILNLDFITCSGGLEFRYRIVKFGSGTLQSLSRDLCKV